MRCLKVIIVLVSIVLLVTGCNTLKKFDKSNEYQKAPAYDKPIVLPSDLNGSSIEDYYPVPKVSNGNQPTSVSTVPPTGSLAK